MLLIGGSLACPASCQWHVLPDATCQLKIELPLEWIPQVCLFLCVSEFHDADSSHIDICTLHSAGYCAQYCTYTTIEQDSRDIVHIVTVDKWEIDPPSDNGIP